MLKGLNRYVCEGESSETQSQLYPFASNLGRDSSVMAPELSYEWKFMYEMKAAQDSNEPDLTKSSRLEGSKVQKSLSGPQWLLLFPHFIVQRELGIYLWVTCISCSNNATGYCICLPHRLDHAIHKLPYLSSRVLVNSGYTRMEQDRGSGYSQNSEVTTLGKQARVAFNKKLELETKLT